MRTPLDVANLAHQHFPRWRWKKKLMEYTQIEENTTYKIVHQIIVQESKVHSHKMGLD